MNTEPKQTAIREYTNTAEAIAARYGISRARQDEFAAESQRRAVAATEAGWFAPEIVPVSVPQKTSASTIGSL